MNRKLRNPRHKSITPKLSLGYRLSRIVVNAKRSNF